MFQSTLILAPKSISSQIAKILRDFLWNGGKHGQNKIHLVKWEDLKCPMLEGGLQIRDPALANLAMTGKLIWQLFGDPKHPVSRIFNMKYLKRGTLRNISAVNTPSGSAIWNSCRKGFEFFCQQRFRIPSNGL